MDPLPPSLEAMVRSRPGSPVKRERDSRWLWLAALVTVIGAAFYFLGIRH